MPSVLVLDDDPSVLSLLGTYLRHSGYAVVLSASIESAVEQMRLTDTIDLLIVDVKLPGGSGVAVAVERYGDYPSLKLLLISGYPSENWSHEDQALLAKIPPGLMGILLKPFSPMAFINKVDELIGPPQSGTRRSDQ